MGAGAIGALSFPAVFFLPFFFSFFCVTATFIALEQAGLLPEDGNGVALASCWGDAVACFWSAFFLPLRLCFDFGETFPVISINRGKRVEY